MAKSIYITGMGFCGKTVLSYGLIKKFLNEGIKATYFKPISIARKRLPSGKYVDTDVIALREALNLSEPIELLSPITISDRYLELRNRAKDVRTMIEDAFKKISEGKDVVVIESPGMPELLSAIDCSVPSLAKSFGSKVVFVVNCKSLTSIDSIIDKVLLYEDYMEKHGYKIHGVIFNSVPIPYLERVREFIVPSIEEIGIKSYGIITEKVSLIAPTVKDIAEALGAEVLEGHNNLNNIVEDILVGAMSPESAMRWFRRAVNAAIVTGGDRTDLIMVALETKPSVVILTGNLYPSIRVLIKAREMGIPILLVPYDTYTTITRLEEAQSIVTPESLKRREKDILSVIEKEVMWKELIE